MIVLVWFDGACEPKNPGGLGTFGYVIRDLPGMEPVFCAGAIKEDPAMTNNYAEYTALGKALKLIDQHAKHKLQAADEIIISGDSKLVVEQVKGSWNCNAASLKPLLNRCRELLKSLPCKWSIQWIPREQNKLADMLSQSAYVNHTGRPFPARDKGAKPDSKSQPG